MSRSSEDDGLIDSRLWETGKPFIYEGFFAYPDGEYETRIPFLIEATEEQGSFTGVACDSETEGLFEKGTVSVKGFVEDGIISFIKTYPCGYFIDESGQVKKNPEKAPHIVEYSGTWSEEDQHYSGTYTLIVKESGQTGSTANISRKISPVSGK